MRSRSRSRSRNPAPKTAPPPLDVSQEQQRSSFEGERLAFLLNSLHRKIDAAKLGNSLPEKFWFKQQFAIGVNEVTRALERMPKQQTNATEASSSIQLQAILMAADCNPKWLTKHLPMLASSRKVPVISVKDKRDGSLRLGGLVKLKTAIVIGVKDKGNGINKVVEEILSRADETSLVTECPKSTEIRSPS